MPLPPGLEGYVAGQEQIEKRALSGLQQATMQQGLLQHIQEQQSTNQMRQLLAQTGGDVEKALQVAIQSGNLAGAHKLAPLVKQVQEERERKSMAGLDMNNPDVMRMIGLKTKRPEFITHAERIEKKGEEEATLKAMKSMPGAVSYGGAGDVAEQVAKPGVFSDLVNSEIPAIARDAKNLQSQIDKAGPGIPVSYWQRAKDDLARREATFLQQKGLADERRTLADERRANAPEPLVPVKEADGRVTYVPRSQAVGREVGVRTTDPNLSKAVQNLGRDFEKAGLNTMIPVIEDAQKITPDQAKWLTGAYATAPDAALQKLGASEGTIQARQALAKFFNITLKDRSGAAVTNQELDRLKEEFGKGLLRTPESLLQAIAKARSIVEKHYQGIAATHGKAALDSYNENITAIGGTPFNHRSTSTAAATPTPAAGDAEIQSAAQKAWGSYDASKYDYRMIDGKLQRRAKGG